MSTLNKTKLKEYGGHVDLNRYWELYSLRCMNFVQRRPPQPKPNNLWRTLLKIVDDLVATIQMEDISPELVLNWDQTGIKLVRSTSWTMNEQGACRVELVGLNDKRQIIAICCGSLVGAFLPIQLIYKGKTNWCHPRFSFPLECMGYHSCSQALV